MTVIVGIAGPADPAHRSAYCRQAITAQRLFVEGDDSELESSAEASLGGSAGTLARHSPYSDLRFSLVADARLDHRTDLGRLLGISFQDFDKLTDADLLLAAWTRWEEKAPDYLNGSFAFALHDRSRQITFLGRDPFGDRPLNFYRRSELLYFSSMPSGLLGAIELKPNLRVLAKDLRGQLVPHEDSAFVDVTRVGPGQIVSFRRGSSTSRKYWQPSIKKLPSSKSELISSFREVMDDAVKSRLVGPSTPVSSTLSSGFDSSAVTGTAARLLDHPELLTAYTSAPASADGHLLPSGRTADEVAIAAKSASMFGFRHRVVRDGSPILSSMRDLSRYFQGPAPNPINLGWVRAILHEVRASAQKTILVGYEGNYTISYGGLLALSSLIRGGHFVRWFKELREAVSKEPHLRLRGALYNSFEPWIPISIVRALETVFDRRTYHSEYDFVHRGLGGGSAPLAALKFRGDLIADRVGLLALHDNGERFKGMTALTGVDELDPTADRRLVDFCLSMEPKHLLHRGESRPIAREAFADRMNPQVFQSPLRGFQSADWYSRMYQSEAFEILEEIRSSSAEELLNLPKLEAAIKRWPDYDPRQYQRLFPFGRSVSQALNMGLFVADTERLRVCD
jgi:asparagine synthase (glutamine-hydrolysing)